MKPLVSVIVPNYNHAPFLKERLESVIHQTYPNFEVILLDDASTDSGKDIIEQYQNHSKVSHVIFNTVNSGSPFLQWRKGIDLALGKYVWIAESDDVCRLNFLEILVPILENNHQLMLAYTDSERDELEWRRIQQAVQTAIQVYAGEEFVRQKMLTSPAIINASAVVFRKAAVTEEILLESGNYKTAFDWLFWCSIALQGKIAFYPAKLNFFRNHFQSTSQTATAQGLFLIEGLRVVSFLKKKYKINLNWSQKKTWSSVWAQSCILLGNKRSMFLKNRKQAFYISPQLIIYFVYYLLKFWLFSKPNIKIVKSE